jgi:hypothetical protein
MPRRRGALGRSIGICALLAAAALACCVASSSGSLGPTYALPSDGWVPGDGAMLALAGGPLNAGLVDGHVCAWLGDSPGGFLWPQGNRVRLVPFVELIAPDGEVVGVGGEKIGAGGGAGAYEPGRPCAREGQGAFLVQGPLEYPLSTG